jgi:hypothetical protein
MPETPRFLNICASQRGFNIRKKDARLTQSAFPGMVVASAEAIYFVPDLQSMPRPPIGGLFGKLLQSPKLGDLGGEMDLAEVPAGITEHSDWPVTWDEGPVFVLPRDAVVSLRTSFMLGGIEIEFAGVRVLSSRRFFAANRWRLTWLRSAGKLQEPQMMAGSSQRWTWTPIAQCPRRPKAETGRRQIRCGPRFRARKYWNSAVAAAVGEERLRGTRGRHAGRPPTAGRYPYAGQSVGFTRL